MRRSASEIINELETRIARLEGNRTAGSNLSLSQTIKNLRKSLDATDMRRMDDTEEVLATFKDRVESVLSDLLAIQQDIESKQVMSISSLRTLEQKLISVYEQVQK